MPYSCQALPYRFWGGPLGCQSSRGAWYKASMGNEPKSVAAGAPRSAAFAMILGAAVAITAAGFQAGPLAAVATAGACLFLLGLALGTKIGR